MQETDTTSSQDLAPAKPDWDFLEVWIDPFLSPPYILLLLGEKTGTCRIHNPAENHKLIFSSATYQEAETWLLEDEYEPLQGRLNALPLPRRLGSTVGRPSLTNPFLLRPASPLCPLYRIACPCQLNQPFPAAPSQGTGSSSPIFPTQPGCS